MILSIYLFRSIKPHQCIPNSTNISKNLKHYPKADVNCWCLCQTHWAIYLATDAKTDNTQHTHFIKTSGHKSDIAKLEG